MKTHIESVPMQPQTKVLQTSLTNKNIKNNEVTLRTTNNKEVKFSYLPEDKVSVAIRNEEGTYTDIKQENLPKELEGLTSPEKFGAFLKSAYVKVSVMSDDESKIYISQKGLGGMWKGDINGDGNGPRANNLQNKNKHQGHVGGGVNGSGKGKGANDGTGAGLGAGVGVGKGGDQIGHNQLNQGMGDWKAGDANKDAVVGRCKGVNWKGEKK